MLLGRFVPFVFLVQVGAGAPELVTSPGAVDLLALVERVGFPAAVSCLLALWLLRREKEAREDRKEEHRALVESINGNGARLEKVIERLDRLDRARNRGSGGPL